MVISDKKCELTRPGYPSSRLVLQSYPKAINFASPSCDPIPISSQGREIPQAPV